MINDNKTETNSKTAFIDSKNKETPVAYYAWNPYLHCRMNMGWSCGWMERFCVWLSVRLNVVQKWNGELRRMERDVGWRAPLFCQLWVSI